MKNIIALSLILLAMVSIISCGQSNNSGDNRLFGNYWPLVPGTTYLIRVTTNETVVPIDGIMTVESASNGWSSLEVSLYDYPNSITWHAKTTEVSVYFSLSPYVPPIIPSTEAYKILFKPIIAGTVTAETFILPPYTYTYETTLLGENMINLPSLGAVSVQQSTILIDVTNPWGYKNIIKACTAYEIGMVKLSMFTLLTNGTDEVGGTTIEVYGYNAPQP